VSNQWEWVIAAYGITWVVLIAYATYLSRRWRRARHAAEGGRL
jgi:CcmD family protein